MISGRQTLASIDQAVNEARDKTAALESEIESLNRELAEQRRAQAEDYQALARLRLDLVADSALLRDLDQVEQQAAALLARRDSVLAELREQDRLAQASLETLEAERAAQADRMDAIAQAIDTAEAATQARLDAEPRYQALREHAHAAERTAAHAAEKASRSLSELEEKGATYLADPLFMYLWRRQFGQPGYRGWGLTRWLDGKVARLIGFAEASANYARLNEIPERLREHAEALAAKAESEFAALKSRDETARAQDGITDLDQQLAEVQAGLDALDARLARAQTDLRSLRARIAGFAEGADDHTRQALALLATELERDDLMTLRRDALATPFPEDDRIVARLLEREDQGRRLETSLQGLRPALKQQQQRLQELGDLRQDFMRNRFDRTGSTFGDDALIAMVIGQFVSGILDRQSLWRILQEQQRYRPEHSRPDFGAGGFARGTPWGGGLPDILGGQRGRLGRGAGGGGFRTGGGTGSGGGFRTGGGF